MNFTKPIIAFGTNYWSDYWASRQHILSRLATRGWPVTYSNGSFFVWDRFGLRWNSARWRDRHQTQDGVKIYWPGRWQMRWPRAPVWDRLIVNTHAQRMLKLSVTSKENRIAYLFHPQFISYLDALGDCKVVYHADDSFALMGQWTDELEEMQRRLIQRADLILASSPRIAAGLETKKTVIQLPNGVDTQAYVGASGEYCPSSLNNVPRPRIGYVGGLNDKVDFTLVYEISRRRPKWHWAFIGSQVPLYHFKGENRRSFEACLKQPNIHILGAKPYKSLPQYLVNLDVNVLCYKTEVGGWWTDIYPLKLHEYLAAGKPVVGAAIDTICEFASTVAIARTVDEWIDAIDFALTSGGVGTPADRQLIASQNDWGKRIDELEKWLWQLS